MSKRVQRNIGVICRINLTVQAPGTSSGIGGGGDSAGSGSVSAGDDGLYRFLTIQFFPCRVVQSSPKLEPIENRLSASFES